MDSDQELSECPLCLEVFEADDLTFFPCTCRYQICRFCWHRIRTDENGLCPACRKPYSENPAQFKPLTEEEIHRVKRDRKLKESNKKPKITESRKHLANLRVVQRNLVFVNGLPSRLDDAELLRRNDCFGKYGKIVKLVTSPAHNGQSNSICVYITYSRSEEALRTIQSLCNYHIDGRTLKATLGTTKYCSRYLKGATCQKTDCLYLHEPGDPLASFTKEQMQQGLHLDYERKLMEQYLNKISSGTSQNGNKNESSQKRTGPLTSTISTSNVLNGHSDFESGDETNLHHSTLNGFPKTTTNGDTLNVDSDISSTSSQTSSENDPAHRKQIQSFNISPSNDFYSTNSNLSRSVPNISNSTNETPTNNNTVKNFDQLPEYKLFSSNGPSIHSILLGNNENNQQSHRPLINGIDHDLRDIERRLMENNLDNNTSYSQTQENDELGFDPCSLFMSALASDIEDERRPNTSQTPLSYRPTSNSFAYTNNSSNSMQQFYHHQHYPEQFQQKQQRYPISINSTPRQMWNGNQQQYPMRLDFSNQIHQQRIPINQSSPSQQYSQTLNNNTVTTQNDRWINSPWTDPAIVSLGNKTDTIPSQWSTITQSQGSSLLSSGNNLMSNPRWSQQQSQTQMMLNGIYLPYSTSNIDDGNRS